MDQSRLKLFSVDVLKRYSNYGITTCAGLLVFIVTVLWAVNFSAIILSGVPLATEPGISLIILPQMRIL